MLETHYEINARRSTSKCDFMLVLDYWKWEFFCGQHQS